MLRPLRRLYLAGLLSCAVAVLLSSGAAAAALPASPWGWGANGSGQLGHGTVNGSSLPVPVLPPATGSLGTLAAGGFHSVGVAVAQGTSLAVVGGTVYAWGDNSNGQLGDGQAGGFSATPVQVVRADGTALSGIKKVSAGEYHSLALGTDGSVWAWGSNVDGQLGQGTFGGFANVALNVPCWNATTQVATPSGPNCPFSAIAAGSFHNLAIQQSSVYSWGYNGQEQLGISSCCPNQAHPVLLTNSIGNAVEVAAGANHSMALDSAGTVWTWGANGSGQLGLTDCNTPGDWGPHGVLGGALHISAGWYYSTAVMSSGAIIAWGANDHGQLGNGNTTSGSCGGISFQTVPGAWTQVSAGSAHTMAVASDGSISAWGANAFGQLGNGTTTDSATPVGLVGLSQAITISAGLNFSLAIAD